MTLMLTPMQVQYIVGLCCLRRNPAAVDITIGDMVLDEASGTKRDVDITVTLQDGPDTVRAFKAYEVKRENPPLDVATVEQLCMKLKDMPSVTHPAIVSASGYTAAAIKKAESHGVELYAIKPWTRPVAADFPEFSLKGKPEDCLLLGQSLLFWLPGRRFDLVAPKGPESFKVQESTPILTMDGAEHPHFRQIGAFWEALILRSTTILYRQDPAATIFQTIPPTIITTPEPLSFSPPWPHSHTLDIARDGVFLRLDGRLVAIEYVTISGHLQWQSKALLPEYHILSRIPDGEVFAGAAIAAGFDDDELLGIIISPDSRTMGIHSIKLIEKQRNAIRELKLKIPDQPTEA